MYGCDLDQSYEGVGKSPTYIVGISINRIEKLKKKKKQQNKETQEFTWKIPNLDKIFDPPKRNPLSENYYSHT